VAASFQTPTLFLIATDLTKMQVDTNVSESDIAGASLRVDTICGGTSGTDRLDEPLTEVTICASTLPGFVRMRSPRAHRGRESPSSTLES